MLVKLPVGDQRQGHLEVSHNPEKNPSSLPTCEKTKREGEDKRSCASQQVCLCGGGGRGAVKDEDHEVTLWISFR